MPGRIKEAPNPAKFRLRVDAVDRENPVQFHDLADTAKWLEPLASKPEAVRTIRGLLRGDPHLRILGEMLDPRKLFAELAPLLKKGDVVYLIPQKPGGGGASTDASSASSSSSSSSASSSAKKNTPSSSKATSSNTPAVTAPRPAASVSMSFDPAPDEASPEPLNTPPPGPGRETTGNTH